MANNNSTFVPGMESLGDVPNPYSTMAGQGSSRQSNSGTYVPGMQQAVPEQPKVENNPVNNTPKSSGAPVVGFLYSVSRGGITEYWPIHLGANVIGRGKDVDICLKEATVSGRHAQINVKQLRVSHKLIANIQDIGSKRGMFLNDEELDYESHTCKNGDVITIGDAYRLLVVLVDTDALGLEASPNFIEIEDESVKEETKLPDFSSTSPRFNPYDRNNSGTVDLSGAAPIGGPGGTMIFEK